jgi:hypothetical protein
LSFFVIPAKAGISSFQQLLHAGLRGIDGQGTFYEAIKP